MEPISAPVGRDVGAMTPNRADFLAADRLPGVLAVLDGVPENRTALGGDDLGGMGGAL